MAFDVSPSTSASAEVVSLASRRRTPPVPEAVWAEVDAAAELWEELRSDGREVRFDVCRPAGRVVAELREISGGIVRSLPLRQAVGDDDGPLTAA